MTVWVYRINLLFGGQMGVSVRKCDPELYEKAQSGSNGCKCNGCLPKAFTGTDCEVAYFSHTKYGDKALEEGKAFLARINPNGKMAQNMKESRA